MVQSFDAGYVELQYRRAVLDGAFGLKEIAEGNITAEMLIEPEPAPVIEPIPENDIDAQMAGFRAPHELLDGVCARMGALAALAAAQGACTPLPPALAGDDAVGRVHAAAAVAPVAAPFRLRSADFFFFARVGCVRERAAPNMPLVLDVAGGDAQPVLLRLEIKMGVASWAHFTGAEALTQRALGDAWTERGRWGSAATSRTLLSDPVFDFPPGAVVVPLLDTTLYRLAPFVGAGAAPNLAFLQHGQSSAVLAYHASAPSGTHPFVLVRPSNRLNTAGAKAALRNFKNRKRQLQHAALVGHLELSLRFNLLANRPGIKRWSGLRPCTQSPCSCPETQQHSYDKGVGHEALIAKDYF